MSRPIKGRTWHWTQAVAGEITASTAPDLFVNGSDSGTNGTVVTSVAGVVTVTVSLASVAVGDTVQFRNGTITIDGNVYELASDVEYVEPDPGDLISVGGKALVVSGAGTTIGIVVNNSTSFTLPVGGGTLSTFAGLGANAPAGWINAAAVSAGALVGKGDWYRLSGTTITNGSPVNYAIKLSPGVAATLLVGDSIWLANKWRILTGVDSVTNEIDVTPNDDLDPVAATYTYVIPWDSGVLSNTGYTALDAGFTTVLTQANISTLTAQQVWEYGQRQLTGGTYNANITQILGNAASGGSGLLNVNVSAMSDNVVSAAALSDAASAKIVELLLKYDWNLISGEASRSLINALRLIRNRRRILSGVLTVYKENDLTVAWEGAVAGDNNAQPVVEVDPG